MHDRVGFDPAGGRGWFPTGLTDSDRVDRVYQDGQKPGRRGVEDPPFTSFTLFTLFS
jgi:hypothetical protein